MLIGRPNLRVGRKEGPKSGTACLTYLQSIFEVSIFRFVVIFLCFMVSLINLKLWWTFLKYIYPMNICAIPCPIFVTIDGLGF